MEWTYTITVETPLGRRHGKLELQVRNGTVQGRCGLVGHVTRCTGTIAVDGTCILEGEIRTFMSRIPYTGRGTADAEQISLVLSAGKHEYRLQGNAEGRKM